MTYNVATSFDIRPEFAWSLLAVLVASFIAFFISFQAGFFCLLFILTGWYTQYHPEQAFLLLVIVMPILPMLKVTQTIATFTLIKDVIIFMLFITCFLVPLFSKKLPYRRNIIMAPLAAIVVWSLIAAVRSDNVILGILRLRDLVLYMLLFFGVLYLKHSQGMLRRRILWFLASACVTLLLAAYQWNFAQDSAVLRFDPVREVWIPRLSSVLAHPSIFGQYLITLSALMLACFISLKTSSYRLMSGLAIGVIAIAVFLTYSRAVWIAFVSSIAAACVLIVVTHLWHRGAIRVMVRWLSLVILGVLVITAFALQNTSASGFIRSVFDPRYRSNEERITFLIRLVASMTTVEALVGRGLGDVIEQNFRQVTIRPFDIATGATRQVQLAKDRTLVDNQYLKTLVEMGVVGIGLYLWLYFRIFSRAFQNSESQHAATRIISLWTVGFMTAFVTQALFIDVWDIFPTNMLFWTIAAHLSIVDTQT